MNDQWKSASRNYFEMMYKKEKERAIVITDQELLLEFEVVALLDLLGDDE